MRDKVYCGQCKWEGFIWCQVPFHWEMEGGEVIPERMRVRNANNDCSYYRRKWYKFWATKGETK